MKLGYGGTQAEMQRLIEDASAMTEIQEELGITVDSTSMSFANIVNAIQVVQKNLGIAGATAEEAEETISGSLAALKGAWENLVVGFADENADLPTLVDNVVNSVVIAAENIVPRIGVILTTLAGSFATVIPNAIENMAIGISANSANIFEIAQNLLITLSNGLISSLPLLATFGLSFISFLSNGIAEALPSIINSVVNVIETITKILVDPNNLGSIINGATAIIVALASGLIANIPKLIIAIPQLLIGLVNAVIANLPILLDASIEILNAIATGIFDNISLVGNTAYDMITAIRSTISSAWNSLRGIGSNIVDGVWQGIVQRRDYFFSQVQKFFSDIIASVKETLGIASPSKVFAEIGKFMAQGLEVGFDDEIVSVDKNVSLAVKNIALNSENIPIQKATISDASNSLMPVSLGDVNLYIDKVENSNGRNIETLLTEIEFIRRQQAASKGVNII